MKILNMRVWVPVLTASLIGLSTTATFADGRGCSQKGGQYLKQGMGCQHRQSGDHYTGGKGCAYMGGQSRGMNQSGMNYAGKGAGMDPGMRIERMTMRLNLSESQQAQIREIMEKSREVHNAMHTSMTENRTALQEAMASGDAAKIRTLADQKGDLIASRIVMKAEKRAQIKALLTPEQQEQFAQMKRRKMHHH